MRIKEIFIIFLKGLFIGASNIVPGVSGGTIALITGIYERLIRSISEIDFKFILYILKGDLKKAKENIEKIDFQLFIPLTAGIVSAIWLMSSMVYFLLENFAVYTYAFFFGLILASAVLIYKKMAVLSTKNILFFLIGFLFAYFFIGLTALQIGHSLPVVFLSGVIAFCTMVLPGISGALVLLFLNQYEYMLSVLKNLQLLEISVFTLGALIGALFFSRFVNHLLNKNKSLTISFLVGLMIGSLRLPYQNIAGSIDSVFLILASIVFGFLIIFILENDFKKFK